MLDKPSNIRTDHHTLIQGCIAGERVYQTALYNLFAPKMMIVCMRYAKNKEEAEEILQNGFIRVFKFIGQYKQEGSFEGWIRKIMVNCALQKLKNNVQLKPLISLDNVSLNNSDYYDIIGNLNGKDLLKMIQTLSPAYRLVFNMYIFEGLKHREIAELLNISVGTSKSNLSDARNILQNKLNRNLKLAK